MQKFCGNPIDRSCGDRKSETFLADCVECPDSKFLFYQIGKILFFRKSEEREARLAYHSQKQCMELLEIDAIVKVLQFQCVVLGKLDGSWVISIEMPCEKGLSEEHELIAPLSLTIRDDNDAAVAGLALTLHNWHLANAFDSVTGARNESCEGGMKRRSKVNLSSKIYPRVNPVVIACVISADGQRCLLGKMKKHPVGFYSCLSGFLEVISSYSMC